MFARRNQAMKTVLLGGVAGLLLAGHADAGESTLGIAVSTQQVPSNFNKSIAQVYGASYGYTFDNKVILHAAVDYFDFVDSSVWHLNAQAGIGYRFEIIDDLSLVGIVSIGSRVQSNDTDFPYYDIHGSVDWSLMPEVMWSVVTFRYRNAFNTDYKFETPALGSSIGLRVTDTSTVSLKYLREWSNGKVADNLIGIGYAYHF